MFENIRSDLRAHAGDWAAQGFWAMVVYRFGRWRLTIRNRYLRKLVSIFYEIAFKIVQVGCGIEIHGDAVIGPGLAIDHSGGVVVSGYTRMGEGCRIRTGVVIGLADVDDPCAPRIGNNVDVGAGAKLLGRITIGDNVRVGANAVVITDIAADCIAVGIPAVARPRRQV